MVSAQYSNARFLINACISFKTGIYKKFLSSTSQALNLLKQRVYIIKDEPLAVSWLSVSLIFNFSYHSKDGLFVMLYFSRITTNSLFQTFIERILNKWLSCFYSVFDFLYCTTQDVWIVLLKTSILVLLRGKEWLRSMPRYHDFWTLVIIKHVYCNKLYEKRTEIILLWFETYDLRVKSYSVKDTL